MNPVIPQIKMQLLKSEYFRTIKDIDKFVEKLYDTHHFRCDIISELKKADFWLVSNPKRLKKSYSRFLCNWFGHK